MAPSSKAPPTEAKKEIDTSKTKILENSDTQQPTETPSTDSSTSNQKKESNTVERVSVLTSESERDQHNDSDTEDKKSEKKGEDLDEITTLLLEEDESFEESSDMPLLHYARVQGTALRPPPRVSNNDDTAAAADDDANTTNSLPFSQNCTCSTMGQIRWSPDMVVGDEVFFRTGRQHPSSATAGGSSSAAAPTAASGAESGMFEPFPQPNNNQNQNGNTPEDEDEEAAAAAAKLCMETSMPLVAMGFANGTVQVFDGRHCLNEQGPSQGIPLSTKPLCVREGLPPRNGSFPPIVDLCLDASGTCLAALDQSGMCTIWEYKLEFVRRTNGTSGRTAQSSEAAASSNNTPQQQQGMFSSFMSALTGGVASTTNNNNQQEGENDMEGNSSQGRLGTWRMAQVQVTRVSYPSSFGHPTALAMDPAYRRRREKAILVGFDDGRLIMTKRGLLFQRRVDNVIYQQAAKASDSKTTGGIQALEWRGALVAWADATGLRLLDVDQLARIAHIDPPVGARPSLYANQVVGMKPHLCFETSTRLLVAWGDCLLQLSIHEANSSAQQQQPSSSQEPSGLSGVSSVGDGSTSGNSDDGQLMQPVVRKRIVSCKMAWQLDVVALGLAPLDLDHVTVLGAVLVPPDDNDELLSKGKPATETKNEIELQIISRANGQVVYADLLPLIRKTEKGSTKGSISPLRRSTSPSKARGGHYPESVFSYNLLSTFHLPRMGDASELQEQIVVPETSFDLFGGAADQATTPVTPHSTSNKFRDPHIRWNLGMVAFDMEHSNPPETEEGEEHEMDVSADHSNFDDDAASVDSDIYDFVTRPLTKQKPIVTGAIPQSPKLMVISKSDAISVRLRTIDDAVTHALNQKKAAMALERALVYLRQLRGFHIGDLVCEYYRSLLRLPEDESSDYLAKLARKEATSKLSLRRMKLAAYSMPVLLGGDMELWEYWIAALGNIPGSLFVVWNRIPVRDPVLPKALYTKALCRMIEHVDDLRARDDVGVNLHRLVTEAEHHFLQALLAWGSTHVLKEFIKLYKYQTELSSRFSGLLAATERSLASRYSQSSAKYLCFPVNMAENGNPEKPTASVDTAADVEALFDVQSFLDYLTNERKTVVDSENVVLEARARVCMMAGDFDGALREWLLMGSRKASLTLDELESKAVDFVMKPEVANPPGELPHAYLISLIENRNLHQCLLDPKFLKSQSNVSPLFAFLRLVDLDLAGRFLMEHCVAPSEASNKKSQSSTAEDRAGTLPLNLVAEQFESRPKLLFWYLHLLFTQKPEFYVSFPKTANPPASITYLHRKALDLYVSFAGDKRDSSRAIKGVEIYRVTQVDTPLLAFLRVVLQLGGIKPAEVGKRLQNERKGGTGVSPIFAIELGHIMEHYGDDSEEECRIILELYLRGAKSLMHAVSFAQRKKEYSNALWEILIDYCLKNSSGQSGSSSKESKKDGSLFGLLLESAALSGANLAFLVSQIPPGMSVEGLRPRLVAAVADYRWKLQMHQGASEVATSEKIGLHREVAHRSRRGFRYYPSDKIEPPEWTRDTPSEDKELSDTASDSENQTLHPGLRPKSRKKHNFLSYALPYR